MSHFLLIYTVIECLLRLTACRGQFSFLPSIVSSLLSFSCVGSVCFLKISFSVLHWIVYCQMFISQFLFYVPAKWESFTSSHLDDEGNQLRQGRVAILESVTLESSLPFSISWGSWEFATLFVLVLFQVICWPLPFVLFQLISVVSLHLWSLDLSGSCWEIF